MIKEAVFSQNGKYRYLLKRIWDKTLPSVCFICLNPSYADDSIDDRMVTKCIRQAKRLGFGSIEMTNLFAYVETVGKKLYKIKDPVGMENDKYIFKAVNRCNKVIIAWGNNGNFTNRSENILKRLEKLKIKLHCLKITSTGQPHHPGRLGYVNRLIVYK